MNALERAIDLELELMGDFSKTQVPTKVEGLTVRFYLNNAKGYLKIGDINFALDLLNCLWMCFNYNGYGYGTPRWETTCRLMELYWRVKKEWRYHYETSTEHLRRERLYP